MNCKRKFFKFLIVIFMSFVLCSSVQAKTITVTVVTGHPPVIPWVKLLDEYFLSEVNRRLAEKGSSTRIKWRKGYGGTIAKIGGVLEALEMGVADMGIVGAIFEPGNLPLQIVSYYTPFATTSIFTAVETVDEMHYKVPALMKSWDKFNQVYLCGLGVENFNLFTKKPIKTLDELKGLKIGGAGPNLNWLRGAGVAGVQINLTTIYNDLATGIYDGVLLFASSAAALKLYEVTPYYLKADFGAMSWGAVTANKDFWGRLPTDVQRVIRDVAKDYQHELNTLLDRRHKNGLTQMKNKGLKISVLSGSERKAWAARIPNIALEWAEPLEKKRMPAKNVIRLWMQIVKEKGSTPLRDWNYEL